MLADCGMFMGMVVFGVGVNGSSGLIMVASRSVHGRSEENVDPHRSLLLL